MLITMRETTNEHYNVSHHTLLHECGFCYNANRKGIRLTTKYPAVLKNTLQIVYLRLLLLLRKVRLYAVVYFLERVQTQIFITKNTVAFRALK